MTKFNKAKPVIDGI